MSRIRTIKPEFWSSEQVVECSPNARLLFIGLWNFCDDWGRHTYSPKQLKALIFPADNFSVDDIQRMFDELSSNGLVELYDFENKHYFYVTGWHHQKIDRKQRPKFPSPFHEHSTIIRRTISECSLTEKEKEKNLDSTPTSEILHPDIKISPCTTTRVRPARVRASAREQDAVLENLKSVLSEQTALDIIAHRKAKRSPLTPRAAKLLAAAFRSHGDAEEAAEAMIANGWQGFRSDWLVSRSRDGPSVGRSNGTEGFLKRVLGEAIEVLNETDEGTSSSESGISEDVRMLSGRRYRPRESS